MNRYATLFVVSRSMIIPGIRTYRLRGSGSERGERTNERARLNAAGIPVRFSLPAAQQVSIDVYTVFGRKVASLHHGRCTKGNHEVRWNGATQNETLASGNYLVVLSTEGSRIARRVILMK